MNLDHYYTVAVIVDGALERETDVDPEELATLIGQETGLALEDGKPTEIWVLHHLHERPDPEVVDNEEFFCACDQYATRHAPYVTFNVPSHVSEPVPEDD